MLAQYFEVGTTITVPAREFAAKMDQVTTGIWVNALMSHTDQ